MNTSD